MSSDEPLTESQVRTVALLLQELYPQNPDIVLNREARLICERMAALDPLIQSDEVVALRAALAEAVSLLAGVDSDANNVQLDIMRWRRRHHKVVPDA